MKSLTKKQKNYIFTNLYLFCKRNSKTIKAKILKDYNNNILSIELKKSTNNLKIENIGLMGCYLVFITDNHQTYKTENLKKFIKKKEDTYQCQK